MKKLKSKAGFTLTEVLISLVIITMGVVLFSGMAQATGAVVSNQAHYRTDLIKQNENLEKNIKNPPAMGNQQAITINVNITNINKKIKAQTGPISLGSGYTFGLALVDGESKDPNVGNIYAYTLFSATATNP